MKLALYTDEQAFRQVASIQGRFFGKHIPFAATRLTARSSEIVTLLRAFRQCISLCGKGLKKACPISQERAEASDFQRITVLFRELDFQNDRALVVHDLRSPGGTLPDGRSAGSSSAVLSQGVREKKDISAKFSAV